MSMSCCRVRHHRGGGSHFLLVTGGYKRFGGSYCFYLQFGHEPKDVFPDGAVCGFSADITLQVVWEGPLQCPRTAELAFATIHVVMCQELSRGEVNIPFHAVWFCYRKLE
jgi:hypothetical protein